MSFTSRRPGPVSSCLLYAPCRPLTQSNLQLSPENSRAQDRRVDWKRWGCRGVLFAFPSLTGFAVVVLLCWAVAEDGVVASTELETLTGTRRKPAVKSTVEADSRQRWPTQLHMSLLGLPTSLTKGKLEKKSLCGHVRSDDGENRNRILTGADCVSQIQACFQDRRHVYDNVGGGIWVGEDDVRQHAFPDELKEPPGAAQ